MFKSSKLLLFITLFGATNQALTIPENTHYVDMPDGTVVLKRFTTAEIAERTKAALEYRKAFMKGPNQVFIAGLSIAGGLLALAGVLYLTEKSVDYGKTWLDKWRPCIDIKQSPDREIIAKIHAGNRLKFYTKNGDLICNNGQINPAVHNVKSIKWVDNTSLEATLIDDEVLSIKIYTMYIRLGHPVLNKDASAALPEYKGEVASQTNVMEFLCASAAGIAFVATMFAYAHAASCP